MNGSYFIVSPWLRSEDAKARLHVSQFDELSLSKTLFACGKQTHPQKGREIVLLTTRVPTAGLAIHTSSKPKRCYEFVPENHITKWRNIGWSKNTKAMVTTFSSPQRLAKFESHNRENPAITFLTP
jgi:hypothetical protein